VDLTSEELKRLYGHRFGEEAEKRDDIWKVLCSAFFQRWIPLDATVLDIAAGHCEFSNNIRAARRIAVDLNPDVRARAAEGVEALISRSDDLVEIPDGAIDRIFISNFFEHLPREGILATLRESRRVLKSDGKLLLLQPNIRYAARNYWRFFDHITPIDDRAMVEAFAQTGFDVERSIPQFLPYTTKGRLPSGAFLVRMYLAVPLAWKFLGGQAFMVATPRSSAPA
jgi:SAM-dependent methyltransferase